MRKGDVNQGLTNVDLITARKQTLIRYLDTYSAQYYTKCNLKKSSRTLEVKREATLKSKIVESALLAVLDLPVVVDYYNRLLAIACYSSRLLQINQSR